MPNLSDKTRKEQVLDALRATNGGWVNTVDISNAQVGGSAGTSRVRDLRKEGYVIDTRAHPDPTISQYQYRLVSEPRTIPMGGVSGTITREHDDQGVRVIDEFQVSGGALYMAHGPEPIARVTGIAQNREGVTVVIDPLPYVKWGAGHGRSINAQYAGNDLLVYQLWSGRWGWRTRPAIGSMEYKGEDCSTEREAKMAAIRAALGAKP